MTAPEHAPDRRRASVLATVFGLIVASAVASTCYNPRIQDGGIACARTGTPCPEGYACAADNRCWRDPTGIVGDGGAEPTCTSPPVTPVCTDLPAAGQACNPACQTGCDCGRCNVVNGVPKCVASGSVKLGEICKVGNDDNCAPGLICLQEVCGNGLGRCYRHCARSDQCAGSICQFQIEGTEFKVCDVPPQTCDPVSDTGCPNAALHCYITSGNTTLCDCANNMPGKGLAGDPCNIYSDCAPMHVCFRNAGDEPRCHLACNIATPMCVPATAACTGGSKYGHCGP